MQVLRHVTCIPCIPQCPFGRPRALRNPQSGLWGADAQAAQEGDIVKSDALTGPFWLGSTDQHQLFIDDFL